jgi:hypothetical protein
MVPDFTCIDHRLWDALFPRLLPRPEREFLLPKAGSFDGIISYLTAKHGGNVHDRGIVTITSKSDSDVGVRNVADLTSSACFSSSNEPSQWICWDFRDRCVRPTHYTIKSDGLSSWALEGSLDGQTWSKLDRHWESKRLEPSPHVCSFPLSNLIECRFIRLTQTRKNHRRTDVLGIVACEFFGTLVE